MPDATLLEVRNGVVRGSTGSSTASVGVAGKGLLSAPYLQTFAGGVPVRLPTRAVLDSVVALVESPARSVTVGAVPRRWGVTLTPGTVRIGSSHGGCDESAWWDGDESDQLALVASEPDTGEVEGEQGRSVRGRIFVWSPKSRVNMIRTVASLDWAEHLERAPAGWRPAMVTLTCPRDWTGVAPSGEAFKAAARRFYAKWAYRYDRPFAGVWKLEFQGRGAPHLHLYGVVPTDREAREWLSIAWTGALYRLGRLPSGSREELADTIACKAAKRGHDGGGAVDHLRAGTGLDWGEGIRALDPGSIAHYFAKRTSLHNVAIRKEYQHVVPVEWGGIDRETGEIGEGGPGRWWGYRGIKVARATAMLDDVQWTRLRRVMRRSLATSRGHARREAEGGRRCRCGRAAGYRPHAQARNQGMTLLAADAPAWLAQALRWEGLAAGELLAGHVETLASYQSRPLGLPSL